jgi:peptidoglycan/xylan/chitin deacetylase (PgdA/CDA1 family)
MQAAVIPFQLTIGGRGGAGYALRATAAGRAAEAAMELPHLAEDSDSVGLALGRALFPPPIRQLLLDIARGADEAGARVQIQLQVVPPELAAVPWELATIGQDGAWRPAVREDYTLVRAARSTRATPPLLISGPLRLLIACAPGMTAAAVPLGHALAEPVRSGQLVVDLLRDADSSALRVALAEEPCHALHLVVDGAGGAASAARLRLGRSLDAQGLASILGDYPELRLVTLAAPEGVDAAALADVAASLHEKLGIGALAIGDLSYEAAAQFAGPCYTALALGDPADLAVTDGRAALAAHGGPWGMPRVWLAPGSDRLFESRPARATAARSPAPAPAEPQEPLPVGTPLRQRRARSEQGRAQRAFAAARSFVVSATTVGEPAQRAKPEAPRNRLLQPRLIALILASLLLAFQVSRVLPEDNGAQPIDEPAASELAAASAGSAALLNIGPPSSVPDPSAFFTYVVAEGDTAATIAERTGSDEAALVSLNSLVPGQPLRPGRPLVVPQYRDGEAPALAPIIERGNPENPLVALTFDIEIDDASLYAILDILAERNIKGTFFVTGQWAQSFPAAAKAIVMGGHEIANHSVTHPAFSTLTRESAVSELAETERLIREAAGVTSRPYFRFPYGDSSPEMVEIAARAGYVAYHWSADDFGVASWLSQAAADPAQAYGGIILLHGRQSTVDALSTYIDELQAMGITPTTLGEVLR